MNYRSRKLIVVASVFIISTIFIMWTRLDLPPNYVDLVKWLVGIYVVGNVGSKFSGKGKREDK